MATYAFFLVHESSWKYQYNGMEKTQKVEQYSKNCHERSFERDTTSEKCNYSP